MFTNKKIRGFDTHIAHAAVQRAALLLAKLKFKGEIPFEVHQCKVTPVGTAATNDERTTRRFEVVLQFRDYNRGTIGYITASILMEKVADHLDHGTFAWEPLQADWISGCMVQREAVFTKKEATTMPLSAPKWAQESPQWMLKTWEVKLLDNNSNSRLIPSSLLELQD